jgi:hypothetical protein
MPTNPKSCGLNSRANTISEPTRRRKFAACAQILADPPRIVLCFKFFIACLEAIQKPP